MDAPRERKAMKTLVLYSSKHGAAEKFAHLVGDFLPDSEVRDVSDKEGLDWDRYDALIMGASIYAGRIRKPFLKFLATHREVLLAKPLRLFVVGADEEKHRETAERNIPAALLEHAGGVVYGGHIFDFERLGFFERFIVRKVAKVQGSRFALREEAARQLAASLSPGA